MNLFLLNVVLAFAWAVVNGSLTARDVAVGFVVGYLILWLIRPALGQSAYHERLWQVPKFVAWYLVELIRANVRVAAVILNPRLERCPAIVAVPLDCESDAEIAAVANLTSLTPGTVSLALSRDRRTLYVHALDIHPGGVEDVRRDIKDGVERKVLELSRGEAAVRAMPEGEP